MPSQRNKNKSTDLFGSGHSGTIPAGRPDPAAMAQQQRQRIILAMLAGVGAVVVIGLVLVVGWALSQNGTSPGEVQPTAPSAAGTGATPSGVAAPASPPPPAASSTSVATATPPIPVAPDPGLVRDAFVDRLNRERRALGLSELTRSQAAADAEQQHAEEMADFGYANSWNLAGLDPAYRYTLEGGTGHLTEYTTLHEELVVYRPDNEQNAGRVAWQDQVDQLFAEMWEDPHYQALVSDPTFNYADVGVGYNGAEERLAIAQAFVRQYVVLEPLTNLRYALGETVRLEGRLAPGAAEPLLERGYAPLPTNRDLMQLHTEPFTSPVTVVMSGEPIAVADGGRFQTDISLDYQNQPGLYVLRVLVQVESAGSVQQLTGAEVVLMVTASP